MINVIKYSVEVYQAYINSSGELLENPTGNFSMKKRDHEILLLSREYVKLLRYTRIVSDTINIIEDQAVLSIDPVEYVNLDYKPHYVYHGRLYRKVLNNPLALSPRKLLNSGGTIPKYEKQFEIVRKLYSLRSLIAIIILNMHSHDVDVKSLDSANVYVRSKWIPFMTEEKPGSGFNATKKQDEEQDEEQIKKQDKKPDIYLSYPKHVIIDQAKIRDLKAMITRLCSQGFVCKLNYIFEYDILAEKNRKIVRDYKKLVKGFESIKVVKEQMQSINKLNMTLSQLKDEAQLTNVELKLYNELVALDQKWEEFIKKQSNAIEIVAAYKDYQASLQI